MAVFAFLAQLSGPAFAQRSHLSSLLAYNSQRTERLYYVRVQDVDAGRNELIGRALQALHRQLPADRITLLRYAPELGQVAARVVIDATPFGPVGDDSLRLSFEFSVTAIPGTYRLTLEGFELMSSGLSGAWLEVLGIKEPTLEALLKAQNASYDSNRAWVLCQIDSQLGKFAEAVEAAVVKPRVGSS